MFSHTIKSVALSGVLLLGCLGFLGGCAQPRLVGLIYTNVRLPLTKNLIDTPKPVNDPPSSKILEIREPISGAGIYAQIDANAIGAIAKRNGMETLYFADQQIFSIFGIWSSNKTILYGD